MITKISKLKKFGIFHDFSWKNGLSDFKRFNLIYGWNRSGKTTVSRVFASCEKKCLYDQNKFKQYPASFDENGSLTSQGEFEMQAGDGSNVKNTDVATNVFPIKVFNQDFIDDNISFDPSDSCNPIVYVSEEDIEKKKRLEQINEDKNTLNQKYQIAKKVKFSKEETKNTFLTSLGREVANILFDKTYNKTKAEIRIKSIGINNFSTNILTDEDKKKYESISKSEQQKNLNLLSKLPYTDFTFLYTRVKSLLDKKVVSELLERLKDPEDTDGGLDEELNNWVKQGFDIHKTRNQFKKCYFCENEIGNNLFDSLSRHFSKDYEDLQTSVEFLIKDVKEKNVVNISDKNFEIYPDLRNEYEDKAKKYNGIVSKQNGWLSNSRLWLEQKYKNPFNPDIPEMVDNPEDFTNILNLIIDELNDIITRHNQKAKNHKEEVESAREKLELHSIAVALTEQDYRKMVDEVNEAVKKEQESFDELNKIISEISLLEKQTSNIGEALTKINKYLEEFFGRAEIVLELDRDKKGYTIQRDGQPAKNLSEGEKTAIAFSYFLVKVGENDFDKSNGIIFIDDPISSFDSNFIYHCFSLINMHFREVGQLFISTHNFQLFNLVKDWFVGNNQNRRKKGKDECCEFFMVENYIESGIRKARIAELDKTLRNYKSEYHFLFAKLKDFIEKIDIEYEDFYTIGNMARRFFDIFADFKIPTTGDQKSKMEEIVKNINTPDEKISMVDTGKAYKIVNEFSHNSDPTSTIEHKDKTESKEAIKVLLNIVKESDPKHFELLEKATQ